ncbi:MAG: hypothetical protein V4760_06595 [Bdellovibrionota bacterium]
MDRSRYFILLALGVLLGASIEYMKDVDPQTAKIARLARLEHLMDGGKVEYLPISKRSALKTKTIHGEVAGLDASPAEPKSETVLTPPKKEDDAKKKKDEKKKKDDKKKKKKKTIKGKGDAKPEGDDSSDDDGDESAAMSPATGGGGRSAIGAIDPNKDPETVEEWVAFLMGAPDFEKTAKFVKLYQNGAIKPEIFYEVVATMIEDDREKMRELAVNALGSTPSVSSFMMLSDFIVAEPGITKPKTQALSYAKWYTRLEYLQFLVGAFKSGNAEASMQALHQINVAVSIHYKGGVSTDPTEQDTTPRAPASNVQRYFAPVAAAVLTLSQTSTVQRVRDEAATTLANINGSTGAQASIAP